MALHLGQIEVGRGASLEPLSRVVKNIERKVEQRGRDRGAVDRDVFFRQVPAAWPHEQGRDLFVELVRLAFGTDELEPTADRVDQVDLPQNDVRPRRRQGVFEIRHEDRSAGVQGVDHHFSLDRPGDLDPALLQLLRCRCHPPVAGPYVLSPGQEIKRRPAVDLSLTFPAALEKRLAGWLELAVQLLEKGQSFRGEDPLGGRWRPRENLDPLGHEDFLSLRSRIMKREPARYAGFLRPSALAYRPRRCLPGIPPEARSVASGFSKTLADKRRGEVNSAPFSDRARSPGVYEEKQKTFRTVPVTGGMHGAHPRGMRRRTCRLDRHGAIFSLSWESQ